MILIVERFKLKDVTPLTDEIKEELRKELNRETQAPKEKRTFPDLLSFIDHYIALCRDGIILNGSGIKLASGSIRNYLSTKSAINKYAEARRIKLKIDSIDIDFYNDFVKYLNETTHARGQYKPNIIGKFIKNIKIFMRYAYENGYTKNEDFKRKEFKVFKEDVDTVYLSESELQALYNLELRENQAHVRDGFLISCYTGLRYSDMSRLEKKHIDFVKKEIHIVTQKTATSVVIPMNRIVLSILEKYGNQPPKIQCNQATNRMIKKICRNAEITEPISIMETKGGIRSEVTYEKCDLVTSHTARRSFATNASKAGVPSLSIMQITGHKTESSFMRYIRVSKEENARLLQTHSFFR